MPPEHGVVSSNLTGRATFDNSPEKQGDCILKLLFTFGTFVLR